MRSKSMAQRLAALEALEHARQPERPPFVCMHEVDWAALNDLATPEAQRQAIAKAYQLGGPYQKTYIGICLCDAGEDCPVCRDQAVCVAVL